MISINALGIAIIVILLSMPILLVNSNVPQDLTENVYHIFVVLLFITLAFTAVSSLYGYKKFEYTEYIDKNITKIDNVDKLYIGYDTTKWEIDGELHDTALTDIVFNDNVEEPYIGTYKFQIGPIYADRDALVIPGSMYENIMETLKNEEEAELKNLTQIY